MVNDEVWNEITRKRRRGLCPALARSATEIEDASKALGEAAGLATLNGLRWLGQPRLVQKLGQILVSKAVPAVYEKETAAVARALRVIGIWLCAVDEALPSCPCLRDLATDQTKAVLQERLEAHLSNVGRALGSR